MPGQVKPDFKKSSKFGLSSLLAAEIALLVGAAFGFLAIVALLSQFANLALIATVIAIVAVVAAVILLSIPPAFISLPIIAKIRRRDVDHVREISVVQRSFCLVHLLASILFKKIFNKLGGYWFTEEISLCVITVMSF